RLVYCPAPSGSSRNAERRPAHRGRARTYCRVTSAWTKAIRGSADPPLARHFAESLRAALSTESFRKIIAEQAAILVTLFAGSEALSNQLILHPDWLDVLETESLKFTRRKQGLRNEVDAWLKPLLDQLDDAAALNRLREFKQKELLRVAARDLVRLASLTEIVQELSDVADICLDAVWRVCYRQFSVRHGTPWSADPKGRWLPVTGCVLGMG